MKATNPHVVNATALQRLGAKAIDALVPLALVLLLPLIASLAGRMTGSADEPSMTAAVVLCALLAGGYGIWLWLWEAGTGRTPGNLALGIRTCGRNGLAPGVVAVLVRNLIVGLSGITVLGPVVVLVSNLWDANQQRQGWHDKAAGTLVVDVRAGRDPLLTGGLMPGAPAAQAPGAGRAPSFPQPFAPSAPLTPSGREPMSTGQVPGRQPAWPGQANQPGQHSQPGQPNQLSQPNQPGQPGQPGQPIQPAPGWTPAPPAAPSAPQPVGTAWAGGNPAAAGPAGTVQTAGQAPGTPEETEEDLEMTRVPARRGPVGIRLRFDDGASVLVTGSALLGRNPSARAGEQVDQLIDFADMGRSVSKTHLHLAAAPEGLWVTDRNSTNGSSVLTAEGLREQLVAQQPVLAPAGSTVFFGDRNFRVVSGG